jgi:hypothetical protein
VWAWLSPSLVPEFDDQVEAFLRRDALGDGRQEVAGLSHDVAEDAVPIEDFGFPFGPVMLELQR